MAETEIQIEEEVKPALGPVSGWLPWNWVSVPSHLLPALSGVKHVFDRVKDSHPVCAVALGAAEDGARTATVLAVSVTEKAARVIDKQVEAFVDRTKFEYTKLCNFESYLAASWSKREHMQLMATEMLVSTRGAQLGLQIADTIFSLMERWTVQYQKRVIRSTRRWIRRTRRSGLPKSHDGVRIKSPRKRVKFLRILKLLSADKYPQETTTNGTQQNQPSNEDKKRKADDVFSDSEASSVDPDYDTEDSGTTDSYEYHSDEQEEETVPPKQESAEEASESKQERTEEATESKEEPVPPKQEHAEEAAEAAEEPPQAERTYSVSKQLQSSV